MTLSRLWVKTFTGYGSRTIDRNTNLLLGKIHGMGKDGEVVDVQTIVSPESGDDHYVYRIVSYRAPRNLAEELEDSFE